MASILYFFYKIYHAFGQHLCALNRHLTSVFFYDYIYSMEKVPQVEDRVVVPPYKNPEHCSKAFQVMNALRQQNQLCDVVLKAANTEIRAHRVVLASSSPYFFAMFTGELSESRQEVVTLREIDSQALELLVEFVYTSEIEVTEDNVQVIYVLNSTPIHTTPETILTVLGTANHKPFQER